jgi:hypothetical protein
MFLQFVWVVFLIRKVIQIILNQFLQDIIFFTRKNY